MKISKPIYNANLEALAHLLNSTLYKKDNEIFLPCKIFAAVNVGTDRKLTPVNALGRRCAD